MISDRLVNIDRAYNLVSVVEAHNVSGVVFDSLADLGLNVFVSVVGEEKVFVYIFSNGRMRLVYNRASFRMRYLLEASPQLVLDVVFDP